MRNFQIVGILLIFGFTNIVWAQFIPASDFEGADVYYSDKDGNRLGAEADASRASMEGDSSFGGYHLCSYT